MLEGLFSATLAQSSKTASDKGRKLLGRQQLLAHIEIMY